MFGNGARYTWGEASNQGLQLLHHVGLALVIVAVVLHQHAAYPVIASAALLHVLLDEVGDRLGVDLARWELLEMGRAEAGWRQQLSGAGIEEEAPHQEHGDGQTRRADHQRAKKVPSPCATGLAVPALPRRLFPLVACLRSEAMLSS
jgi:hypothetical protein